MYIEDGFQERLRERMDTLNINSRELGEKSGVSKRTIDGWLGARKQVPSIYAGAAVAKILNTSLEFLATGMDSRYDGLELNHKRFQKFVDIASEEQLGAMWNLIVAMQEASEYLKNIGT